jgi:urease accessory protein
MAGKKLSLHRSDEFTCVNEACYHAELLKPVATAELGRQLRGQLLLHFVIDEKNCTQLTDQFFSPPFHLSKPYRHPNSSRLHLSVASPAAGIFPGDLLQAEIRLSAGAMVSMGTVGATRVHPGSVPGKITQRFSVGEDAWLEYAPEQTILHAGSELSQQTEIHLQKNSSLYFQEILAPGRTSSGECFRYRRFSSSVRVSFEGELVALERVRMEPGSSVVCQLQQRFPRAYCCNLFLAGPLLERPGSLQETVHQLATAECLLGLSQLSRQLWSCKIVAAGSLELQRILQQLRGVLKPYLPQLKEQLRG